MPGIGTLPVFTTPRGLTPEKWYTPTYLRTLWKGAPKAAALEPIALKNATRHPAGMQLLGDGADLEDVRLLLGHADTKTTRKDARRELSRLKRLRDNKVAKGTVVNLLSTTPEPDSATKH